MSDTIEEATPDQTEQYVDRKLYNLDINRLTQDPNQPRKYFDDAEIAELGNSIKKHGVLQPILFRQGEDGQLIIVSGERRFRASTLVKMAKIPAIYTAGNTAEIALIENLLRVDLTPLEEAEGLKKLQEEAKYKNKELAAVIGKAESSISEILSLNKLPEKIKAEVRTNKIFSRRQLIEIAKIKDEKEQKKRFNAVKKINTSGESQKEKKDDKRSQAITTLKRMIHGLSSKLKSFDLSELDEKDVVQVKTDLQDLYELISQKAS